MEAEDGIPFVRVSPHSMAAAEDRRKQADVPFVGSALWAAPRLLEHIRAL